MRIHDRCGRIDQALLLGLLVTITPAWLCAADENHTKIETIGPSDSPEPEGEIRFGDPETFEVEPQDAPQAKPAPAPSVAVPPKTVVKKPEVSTKPIADRVMEIIRSVPPGSEYPEQFNQLISLGPDTVPTLANLYLDSSAEWQSRWIAAMTLGRLGGIQARETLEKGLIDKLFLIRLASAEALGNLGDTASAPALRKALSDRAMVVRSSVVDALANLKDKESIPLLVAELSEKRNFHRGQSLWVRTHIIEALGQIGGKEAVPSLISLLREDNPIQQERVCSALRALEPTAPPAVEAPLKGENCATQWTNWQKANVQDAPKAH